MTRVGEGGVVITGWQASQVYRREYRKLPADLQALVKAKLGDLQQCPRPPGLRFEKLKGHHKPPIYTVHITGNYKLSFEVAGSVAWLRRVAPHKQIDRAP